MPNLSKSGSVTNKELGEISYACIGQPSSEELNNHLSEPIPGIGISIYELFNENELVAPFRPEIDPGIATAMGAKNGVDLYRLHHNTTLPTTGQTKRVSSLLAIPKVNRSTLPMVSWQHGTLFEAEDAPSCIYKDQGINRDGHGIPRSIETLFNVISLAGNGYIVVASDYVGNGISTDNQAYAIK